MHSRSTPVRPVTLFVTGCRTEPSFTRTAEAPAAHPYLLDADNLQDAAALTGRLRNDTSSGSPVTLLRIDTRAPAPVPHTAGRCDHLAPRRTIPFPATPRLLAGLIADAVRVDVADGAVIGTAGAPPMPQQLRAEVTAHLEHAGFDVAFDVPGWVLDDERLTGSG